MEDGREDLILCDYRDTVPDVFSGGLFRRRLDFMALREGGE